MKKIVQKQEQMIEMKENKGKKGKEFKGKNNSKKEMLKFGQKNL